MHDLDHNFVVSECAFEFFDRHVAFAQLAKEIDQDTFFITGGSGLFGSWILSFFEWAANNKFAEPNVTVLSRKEFTGTSRIVKFVVGNVLTFNYEDFKPCYTLHMAAPSAFETFHGLDEIEKFFVLTKGTERFLEFSRHNTKKRTLVLSSGAVFGGFDNTRLERISELERLAPTYGSNYQALSVGKRAVEFLTREFCNKNYLDASVARCFTFIGAGLPFDIHYAVGNFVVDALTGKDIVIKGDGTPQRSYMHLGDMVFWIITILLKGEKGEDYNVGSKHGVSLLELATLVKQVLNAQSEIKLLNESNNTAGNPPNYFYVPDTSKVEQSLGLFCHADLETSLIDYAQYVKRIIT